MKIQEKILLKIHKILQKKVNQYLIQSRVSFQKLVKIKNFQFIMKMN